MSSLTFRFNDSKFQRFQSSDPKVPKVLKSRQDMGQRGIQDGDINDLLTAAQRSINITSFCSMIGSSDLGASRS